MGKKEKTEKTTVIKDHKNIDQLLLHAHYVSSMFESIFESSRVPEIITHEDSVSMMIFDMALLYIKYDSNDNVLCVVSIFDECYVLLIAELMCCLKDIFKENIYVNEETYIKDPVNGDLIWGRDNIDDHNDRVWGRKIAHTVQFDETLAGHG